MFVLFEKKNLNFTLFETVEPENVGVPIVLTATSEQK